MYAYTYIHKTHTNGFVSLYFEHTPYTYLKQFDFSSYSRETIIIATCIRIIIIILPPIHVKSRAGLAFFFFKFSLQSMFLFLIYVCNKWWKVTSIIHLFPNVVKLPCNISVLCMSKSHFQKFSVKIRLYIDYLQSVYFTYIC